MTEQEIIDQYSTVVRVLALARTQRTCDADDVYQEVFYRYIDKKPTFRDEEHARAWFIRVTMNVTKNMQSRFDNARRSDVVEIVESRLANDFLYFTVKEYYPNDLVTRDSDTGQYTFPDIVYSGSIRDNEGNALPFDSRQIMRFIERVMRTECLLNPRKMKMNVTVNMW